jgi:hypothetical protein
MRSASIVCAIFLAACAGGQTGEITMLGACREPIGTTALGEPSDAGRAVLDQLAAISLEIEAPLAWQSAERTEPTQVSVSFAPTGEPAVLLGGDGCERPWLEVPVSVRVQTEDGALDEMLAGSAFLSDADAANVYASTAIADVRGELEPPGVDPERASLRVDLLSQPGHLEGQVLLNPGDDSAGYELIASF